MCVVHIIEKFYSSCSVLFGFLCESIRVWPGTTLYHLAPPGTIIMSMSTISMSTRHPVSPGIAPTGITWHHLAGVYKWFWCLGTDIFCLEICVNRDISQNTTRCINCNISAILSIFQIFSVSAFFRHFLTCQHISGIFSVLKHLLIPSW